MKAMLLTMPKCLEITDVPDPELGPHDVLVRVAACGICGSDVHGFDGSSGRRIPPLIMGHEAAGEVEAVGPEVRSVRTGDRVTFDSMVSCGRCRFCRRGQVNLCDDRRVLGVSCDAYRRHGAFAQLVAVPEHIVYRIPDALSLEHAALVEPVSIAVHAVGLSPVALGDTAVVVGTGMIGLLLVQVLRLAGCGRVIAVDLDDRKLAMARTHGADEVLNARHADVPAEVARLTAGRGADLAVEAVGAEAPVDAAVRSVRKGGAVTLVGNVTPSVPMPLQEIVTRQIALRGSCGSCGQYPTCIELLAARRVRVDALISATAPLDEGPAWFDRLHRGAPGTMKVLLQPG